MVDDDDIFLDMEQIGTLVRETRERHGLSQARLARRASTTQAVVSRIERGLTAPSFETAARLLGAMGWDLELGLRRSRWQDHDAQALREFGELTPQQRLAGVEHVSRELGLLRGAARAAGHGDA